ncbi:MAG: hypothetical protein V1708_04915 [Candidatus Micrarchaeota archaeon]
MAEQTIEGILRTHGYTVHAPGFNPEAGGQIVVAHEVEKMAGDLDFATRRELTLEGIRSVLMSRPEIFGTCSVHGGTVRELEGNRVRITANVTFVRERRT